jgi:hypothetical protein
MKSPLTIVLILFFYSALSQQNSTGNPAVDLVKRNFVDNYFIKKPDSLNLENISGTPYITEGFKYGNITLRNKKRFDSVLLRFNAYNNEITFLKDGAVFAIDSALEVCYLDNSRDSNTLMIFRSGYAAIDKQTGNSYYQLMAGGNKVHLLKFIWKQLEEYTVPGTGIRPKKELVTLTKWYMYSEADDIHEIKLSRKSVEKALPSLVARIEVLAEKNNLKLSKDDDVITLVQLLDKR